LEDFVVKLGANSLWTNGNSSNVDRKDLEKAIGNICYLDEQTHWDNLKGKH